MQSCFIQNNKNKVQKTI